VRNRLLLFRIAAVHVHVIFVLRVALALAALTTFLTWAAALTLAEETRAVEFAAVFAPFSTWIAQCVARAVFGVNRTEKDRLIPITTHVRQALAASGAGERANVISLAIFNCESATAAWPHGRLTHVTALTVLYFQRRRSAKGRIVDCAAIENLLLAVRREEVVVIGTAARGVFNRECKLVAARCLQNRVRHF